jgi:hypothetical protein
MRNSLADIGAGFAQRSEVTGTNTTGTISSGSNSLTVASATGINVGDFVVGEGIAPGTTVSAISGTTITLSGVVGAALSTDPVTFYISNKALSPGLVGGQLCRAWVNFSDENTTIRASFNVSSVTDNSHYNTVNFLTAMPDTNYCIVGASGDSGSDSGCWFTTGYNVNGVNTNNTTTSFRIEIYYSSGGIVSTNAYIYAAVFR